MKRNKILYGAILFIGLLFMSSCSQSFLDVKPRGTVLEDNYYSTPAEALAGLIAAYGPTNCESGDTYCNPLGPTNSASDDCYAGGGGPSDMNMWQAMNNMTILTPANNPSDMWKVNFQGVTFSNLILSKLDGVPGLSAALKTRYVAEAKFLRAYYYFHLVRWYKNVPLFITATTLSDVYAALQADPKDVYAQIEKDLTEAIPDLPATVPASENGRATQGSAKAWLGTVYLYEQKWSDAANILKDVNGTPGGTSQYGYKLMANFGDIFSPARKFNSESIFEIQKTSTQKYGWGNWGQFKSNVYALMTGPRTFNRINSSAPDLYSGWSFTPITPDLYGAMVVSGVYDPRYAYTIINLDSLVTAGACKYDKNSCFNGTGYFIAKYAPIRAYTDLTSTPELNFGIDYIEIRLADTYLMEAEALVMGGGDQARAAALLNAVRARVGLAPVTVSMAAIKNERRLELATEGHRFFDLVRWGDADKVLNHMQSVSNLGQNSSFNGSKNFVVGKNEILPIPLSELTNTKIVQNPGY